MTSKNYLCKSIKENIRRNMFLTILISLALLVVFPVYCITGMEGAGQIEAYMGMDGYQRMLLRCIGPDSPASIVVVAAAVLYALLGFGYLYSGEKTDFYHSLPMKREALYLVSLVSGLISFVVPYLVSIWNGLHDWHGEWGKFSLCTENHHNDHWTASAVLPGILYRCSVSSTSHRKPVYRSTGFCGDYVLWTYSGCRSYLYE